MYQRTGWYFFHWPCLARISKAAPLKNEGREKLRFFENAWMFSALCEVLLQPLKFTAIRQDMVGRLNLSIIKGYSYQFESLQTGTLHILRWRSRRKARHTNKESPPPVLALTILQHVLLTTITEIKERHFPYSTPDPTNFSVNLSNLDFFSAGLPHLPTTTDSSKLITIRTLKHKVELLHNF